jgi:hypothetical protein
MTVLISTVSPSLTVNSVIVPETVDGTSAVTLSVITSQSGS